MPSRPTTSFDSHLAACLAGALLLLAVPVSLEAQTADLTLRDLGEAWRWRIFDRDSVLPAGPVAALERDNDDNVFIATDEGLFAYDGFEWEEVCDISPLGGQPITQLLQAGGNVYVTTPREIWVLRERVELHRAWESERFLVAASPLGGLYAIDLERGEHVRLERSGPVRVDDETSLPRGAPRSYVVDDERMHFLATSAGLFKRDVEKGYHWREETRLGDELTGLPCVSVFLVRFQSIRRVPQSNRVARSPEIQFHVWALFEDLRGGLILARRERQGDSWSWTASRMGSTTPLVTGIARDGFGNHYATAADGALYFSRDGSVWERVPKLGVEGVKVRFATCDLHDYMWFGLEYSDQRGGVARFDGESRRWQQLRDVQGPSEGQALERQNVLSLLEASDGSIWVGTEAGLFQYQDGIVRYHRDAPLERVTGLAEQRGVVWISSASAPGAYSYDQGLWPQRADLAAYRIRRVVPDRRGKLWFLASEQTLVGHALFRLGVLGELERYEIAQGPVNDFFQARDGEFWAATEAGLVRLALERDKLVVRRIYSERDGLRSTRVWAAAENTDGSVWICYRGSGLTRLDGDVVTNFDEASGLGGAKIWSIMCTGSELEGWNVWLGTDRGLSRFDGECWYHSIVPGPNGRPSSVWPIIPLSGRSDAVAVGTFGNGVYRFHKDDRRRPKFTSDLSIAPIRRKRTLRISWEGRDFKENTPTDRLLYRHRFAGQEWSPFSNQRSLDVSLAPGEHSFYVEVRDLDGNANSKTFVQDIRVLPSRLMAPWMLALAIAGAVVLAGIVAAIVVARARRLRRPILGYLGRFVGLDAPVLVVDRRSRIVDFNGVAPELLGLDELGPGRLRRLPSRLVPLFQQPAAASALVEALAGRATEATQALSTAADGPVVLVRALPVRRQRQRGVESVIGAVVFLADVTRSEGDRQEVTRTERLGAVRELAGNLHRQLESSVEECRAALERLAAASPESALDLAGLRAATARVEELASALGVFAGLGPRSEREETSLLELVEGLVGPGEGAVVSVPPQSRVDVRGQPGLWSVRVNRAAMSQALAEVLRNAVDATADGGVISVRLSNRVLDGATGPLAPGRWVEVTVSDSGPGLDANQLRHVFDPLFSTKSRLRHRGVGLSIALGLVRGHGGDIRVESPSEGGARVTILLPAAGTAAAG